LRSILIAVLRFKLQVNKVAGMMKGIEGLVTKLGKTLEGMGKGLIQPPLLLAKMTNPGGR
jgi:hypothetical protein